MARTSRSRPSRREGERGAVLVVVTLLMPVTLMMAGFAVDLGHLFWVRTKLQGTADASALAAASQLPDESAVDEVAREYAWLNYPDHGAVVGGDDVVLGVWSADEGAFIAQGSDEYPAGRLPNAVRVTARRADVLENPVPLFFGGLIGKWRTNVAASAIAARGWGDPEVCVYQLDPSAKPGFSITSSSHVDLNCAAIVNATHQCEALEVLSGSSLRATEIDVASTCAKVDGSPVSPAPNFGAAPTGDPLESLEPPPVGSCSPGHSSETKYDKDGHTTIWPGVYCQGLVITGSKTTVTMQPGTYVMRGKGFKVQSGARVVGDGVTIYNSCNSSSGCVAGQSGDAEGIEISSGSTARLTAPADGPLAGILFFQDRNMKKDVDNEISSGTDTLLDGTAYFPTQYLEVHSGSATTSDLKLIIIAGQLEVSSNSRLEIEDFPTTIPDALAGVGQIFLVR